MRGALIVCVCVQVLLVCCLFFMLFGIVCVNYLKGTFNGCGGADFRSLSPDVVEVLHTPVEYASLTPAMQTFFRCGAVLVCFQLFVGYVSLHYCAFTDSTVQRCRTVRR